MLKNLRNKKTAKWIWVGLAIIVIPPFVIWGSSSLIRSKDDSSGYAGKISGKRVSLLEYRDAMSAVKNQMLIRFGEDLPKIQQYLNLESQAWDRLILLDEAKRRKIKIPDKEVIEAIEKYPFFQRKGSFDERIYNEMLQYVFHTQARIFEEETRQNLMITKIYDKITEKISLAQEEIKKEYRKLNEQLSIHYIYASRDDFAKNIAPAQEEIKDYFGRNSLQFKKPLSFNLEYMPVRQDESSPEAAAKKLNEVIARVNKKESLSAIAKETGLELKETGLFAQTESIPGIGWSQEILLLLSKAQVGQTLNPVLLDKTYYILRLKEKREPYVPGLEEIKGPVRQALIEEKAGIAAKDKIEECLKKLNETYPKGNKEMDFDKFARLYAPLKSGSTGLFKYGSYIEGIGSSDEFFLKAQGLKDGQLSGLISAPGGFYIIRLKNIIPADEKKFEEEKTAFGEKLLERKRNEAFGLFLNDLRKKAFSA